MRSMLQVLLAQWSGKWPGCLRNYGLAEGTSGQEWGCPFVPRSVEHDLYRSWMRSANRRRGHLVLLPWTGVFLSPGMDLGHCLGSSRLAGKVRHHSCYLSSRHRRGTAADRGQVMVAAALTPFSSDSVGSATAPGLRCAASNGPPVRTSATPTATDPASRQGPPHRDTWLHQSRGHGSRGTAVGSVSRETLPQAWKRSESQCKQTESRTDRPTPKASAPCRSPAGSVSRETSAPLRGSNGRAGRELTCPTSRRQAVRSEWFASIT